MDGFERFAAIDWSGAKGSRHKGVAIAICDAGDAAPSLVLTKCGANSWSRTAVLDWLLAEAKQSATLFGFDFSFAPPIIARGAYLPGEKAMPDDAKSFWAYVDGLCADEDLGAASFIEVHHRPHFYMGAADGVKSAFLHHRVCEQRFNATGGGKASTLYDAIGAAQVAKASFAGMRLLHRLGGHVPVWPIDRRPSAGSAIVEIYTRLFIRLAGFPGCKLRHLQHLNQALAVLGSAPVWPATRSTTTKAMRFWLPQGCALSPRISITGTRLG